MSETETLLERLRDFPKTYFFRSDVKKFYSGKEGNLPVILNRLVKKKKIIRLMRNLYALNLATLDWEMLASELVKPAYISLEYALWRYGLITEIPARITLVTTGKSRIYTFPGNVFEYVHINPTRFFGYTIEKNTLLAEKEKTLMDELYLISLKKRSFNLKNINLSPLDKKLLKKWVQKYPVFTEKLLHKILN